jgi:hypothetical protein
MTAEGSVNSDSASSTEVIESSNATTWMGKDRIIWIKIKPVNHHNLDDAKSLVDAHNRLAAGKPCRIICDMRHAALGADSKARDYYVGPEASKLKIAMAMVVASRTQRFVGTLFLRFNRPPYPMQLFREPADAIAWLETYPESK